VRVLNWPLPLLTSVYFLSVTELVRKKRNEISLYANASEGEILTRGICRLLLVSILKISQD